MLGVGLGIRMIAAASPAPPVPAPPGKPLLPSPLRRRSSSCWFSNGNAHERDSATATTSRAARRRWWSDPEPNQQDYGYTSLEEEDDYEYEDEDEDEAAFPGLGGAGELFDEPWFSKVFKTYGYLLPVMLASMLAATGLKAFLMAMAIPLGQSAISFLLYVIWGRRRSNRDDRSRRPFQEEEDYPEDTTDFATGGRGNRYTSSYYEGGRRRQDSYKSWVPNDFAAAAAADDDDDDEDNSTKSSSSEGEGNKSSGNFGGWDELLNDSNVDTQEKRKRRSRSSFSAGNTDYSKRQRPAVNEEEDMDNAAADRGAAQGLGAPPARMRMRRRRGMPRMTGLGSTRYKQVPILMRLLVAVFPFLGSWFRLL